MMSPGRSLALSAVLPLFAACGFSSGLPGDLQGKDMSPAENKAFCEAQASYVSDALGEDGSVKFVCLLGGAFAGMLSGGGVEACEKAYDDCMAEPAKPSESGSECPGESTPDCTATVAEMEACVVEQTSTIEDKLDGATCASVMSDATLLTPGPKCQLIKDKGCEI